MVIYGHRLVSSIFDSFFYCKLTVGVIIIGIQIGN